MCSFKFLVSISLGVLLCTASFAGKKQFSMDEAVLGIGGPLAPQGLKQTSWQPGTHHLWFTANKGEAWVRMDAASTKADTLVRIAQINTALKLSLKAMPALKWIDKEYVYFINGKGLYRGLQTVSGFNWELWTNLPEGAENITVDKSMRIAYTLNNNLFLVYRDESGNMRTDAISNETLTTIVNGQSVHRDEFGIDHGIFFSPAGHALAYYRMDQSMVNDYPIIRWGSTPAKVDNIKYPMAGGVSHQVTVHVYFPLSKRDVTLTTGLPKDQYLTGVSWSPDEQFIYIGVLNRDQNHLWLNQYRADNGAFVKTLFEETDAKYVHPTHGLSFLPGTNDKFIWWSQKDGYEHLYLYGTDGKLIKKLTEGKWVVNELLGMDKSNNTLIVTTAKESPLCKNVYTVNWNNAALNRIDKGEGMHTATCTEDGKYVLDVYNGKGVPKKTVIRNTESAAAKTLITSTDPLADYDRPTIKDITLKANDGTPLYGKLILPTSFDSNKKYPVIVYLYNGPNVQLIHNSFPESGNLWYEYMAQHGYVVFSMDGRGSWNRGLAFEQATFRKLGTVEMEDQLKGVEFLKTLSYVDANRMGVHGWSFGGFMTTSLMLRNPDVFKCAVAGGPVMDWKMYEIMYTERYMDDPKTNADGYEEANLLTKVNKLKGKLLLIHGTDDNTVVWQHSINFIKKCVDEGVQVDYFVYPGYEHNVRGKDRVHLMQKITDYFDEYLKR